MKILTEDLLREYGFMDDPAKTTTKVKVMQEMILMFPLK